MYHTVKLKCKRGKKSYSILLLLCPTVPCCELQCDMEKQRSCELQGPTVKNWALWENKQVHNFI